MTPLNTIIEEEKKLRKQIFTKPVSWEDIEKYMDTAIQRAYEAGEREAHLKNTRDLITIGERIKSGKVTIEQYLERWRGHLDTLLSKIRS